MNKIKQWFEQNTHHHSEYKLIDALVEQKREKNLSISLCFPTLNEENTIGKSIVLMKSELMDRFPLIDEIAVVDSGSEDKTLEIAREFGADTYCASDYLPSEGNCRGKGENLWKAVHLLKGDIIVYIDSDISNIHHRFAYGLIGPLLQNDNIKFVKAFYERPYKEAAGLMPSGGGRVTEILIRPLFSQFFPDLAGIIQPLSGEYAGRREIFEQIAFPIGYGVETAMLIDIYENWGLDVIAQTDLDQRIHRNQSVDSLRRMSFGIMQTFWKRLAKYREVADFPDASLNLREILKSETGHDIAERLIEEKERRPIIGVEEYRTHRSDS